MAFRSDVTIDFEVSPRVISIAAPSSEITIQDLVDTVRVIEDQLINLDNDHILDAAGKEDLGGGTLVGITVTLRDAIISFEDRAGPSFELMSISGGNLVAVDSLGDPLIPVSPSAFTAISFAQSSSATLSNNDSSDVVAKTIWDYPSTSMISGSIGEYVKDKILSTVKFLGLK